MKNIVEVYPGQMIATNHRQVRNNAGGFVYGLSPMQQLRRFLILGTEGGTYYVSSKELTQENANCAIRCIAEDGQQVVRKIIEVSESGCAPKQNPCLFTLALASSIGDLNTRKDAIAAIPKVCRTATHLFTYINYVKQMRGWGRSLRNGIASWYQQSLSNLVYQSIKYQNRNGMSHKDVLCLTHPKTQEADRNQLFNWIVTKEIDIENCPDSLRQLKGFLLTRKTDDVNKIACLVRDYCLPWECLDSKLLTHKSIWKALLHHLPLTAMVRNLATMTKIGVFEDQEQVEKVLNYLSNKEVLRKSRIHPLQILAALMTYQSGRGYKSDALWTPVSSICDVLEKAFYKTFVNVEPTRATHLLALDVSGSMTQSICNMPYMSASMASVAMALVTANVEPFCSFVAFSSRIRELNISKKNTLESALKKTRSITFGCTDCAQPMLWAMENKLPVEVFVIYTDSETWYGDVHPSQALQKYRHVMGINAKLVVVGMTSTGFSIADPSDPFSMDVVGFDTSVPQLIENFIQNKVVDKS